MRKSFEQFFRVFLFGGRREGKVLNRSSGRKFETNVWDRKIMIRNHFIKHVGAKLKTFRHKKFIFLQSEGGVCCCSDENALWIYEKALKFVGCVGPCV